MLLLHWSFYLSGTALAKAGIIVNLGEVMKAIFILHRSCSSRLALLTTIIVLALIFWISSLSLFPSGRQ